MASNPVVIVNGSNENIPSDPVRIVNWSDFIDAVATELLSYKFPYIDLDTTIGTPEFRQGRVFWDNVDSAMSYMQMNGSPYQVTQQINQEANILVWNDSGVDIPNGSAVYITGSLAYRPTIALANASTIPASRIVGMSTMPIPKNTLGVVTTFGLVRDMDTQGFGWNEGDKLFLSDTVDGQLLIVPPTSGVTIRVGIVIRRHPSLGMVWIQPERSPFFGCYTSGNYTVFEYDGTMVSVGDATCWRDELGPLTADKLYSPAGDFEFDYTEGAIIAKSSARYPTDYIVAGNQLNHDMPPGTDVEAHLHWEQTTAAMPNWLVGYRWQRGGQAKTTAWTLLPWTDNTFTWTAGTLNQITDFGYITPPVGYGQVSDRIQYRVFRDVLNTTGLFSGAEVGLGNMLVTDFDTHRLSNMLGSRLKYSK